MSVKVLGVTQPVEGPFEESLLPTATTAGTASAVVLTNAEGELDSSFGGLPPATAAGQFLVSEGAGSDYEARVLASADIPNNAANTTGTAASAASVTGVVGVPNGGTGANNPAQALINLGIAASGENEDITSMTGISGVVIETDEITVGTSPGPVTAITPGVITMTGNTIEFSAFGTPMTLAPLSQSGLVVIKDPVSGGSALALLDSTTGPTIVSSTINGLALAVAAPNYTLALDVSAPIHAWDFNAIDSHVPDDFGTDPLTPSNVTLNAVAGMGTNPVGIFNGTDSYAVGLDDATLQFDGTQPISISVWINPTSLGADSTIVGNLNSAAGNYTGWELGLAPGLRFSLINNYSGGNYLQVTNGTDLSTNTPYHLVVTYDGSKTAAGVQFYVNGVNVSSVNDVLTNALSSSAANTNPVYVGTRIDASFPFAGAIGYLQVFQAKLTQQAVSTIFSNGPVPSTFTLPRKVNFALVRTQ